MLNNKTDKNVPTDLAHTLMLIKDVLVDKSPGQNLTAKAVAQKIKNTSGMYVSSRECKNIMKDYSGLLRRPNIACLILSTITSAFLFTLFRHQPFNAALSILFTPLWFVFYVETSLFCSRLKLREKLLVPAISTNPSNLPSVAVIIASRNEPFDVAKLTFQSALSLSYPDNKKQVIVVDNSDVDFEDYILWRNHVLCYAEGGQKEASENQVKFIHRTGTDGYKPRNLDIALAHVHSDLILYLDIDSTMHNDSLLRLAPILLRDKRVAYIQTQALPTNFSNNSVLSMANCVQGHKLRFDSVFLAHTSHTLFYGHNAIWRTSVVREIGNCLEHLDDQAIVTEDLSMSFRACLKGYRGIGTWCTSGEWVPESLSDVESMWLRWTFGTYQVYQRYSHLLLSKSSMSINEVIGWGYHFFILLMGGLMPLLILIGLVTQSKVLALICLTDSITHIIQIMVSTTKISLGNMRPVKKFLVCYCGTFLLSSFINWTKLKGLTRFVLKQKQGWKPTGKTASTRSPIIQTLKDHWGFASYGLFTTTYTLSLAASILMGSDDLSVFMLLSFGIPSIHCFVCTIVFLFSSPANQSKAERKKFSIQKMNKFY